MREVFGEILEKKFLIIFELLPFFSSPVQSTGRAIVVTLASALALPFPSRHF